MPITKQYKRIIINIATTLMLLVVVAVGLQWRGYQMKKGFSDERPAPETGFVYDYADILGDVQEAANRSLANFKKQYSIEAVILTIGSVPENSTIEDLAAGLLSQWEIGVNTGGRGLLILLSDEEKLVKLEVSYELEDVFTDGFCGYIEDKQLKNYYLSDQLNIGLVAVLEEIEKRAQIKHQGEFTPKDIDGLDQVLLSGGAGAKRLLTDYEAEKVLPTNRAYPAGTTPAEAWQSLIRVWQDKVRDPDLGVYTEITKLAYRDFRNLPDSRFEEDVATYKEKPYEVIRDDDYAVIFFGKKKGWENAPFLFCRTAAGWRFDIVHQRKYIRMGRNPHWGIERANYPYVALLSRCSYWMNQDIPLEGEDVYRIANDAQLAQEIKRLESAYGQTPQDFDTVMQLGRLYTITSLSPGKRLSFLKKASNLQPQNPLPYKYMGIVHLDAFYQYGAAIKAMEIYVKRLPDDIFGRNYLGYLYLCEKRYEEAIEELTQAILLRPDNCYAYEKLSRSYAGLYLQAPESDSRRTGYRKSAIDMLAKASQAENSNPKRIQWLRKYLQQKKIES